SSDLPGIRRFIYHGLLGRPSFRARAARRGWREGAAGRSGGGLYIRSVPRYSDLLYFTISCLYALLVRFLRGAWVERRGELEYCSSRTRGAGVCVCVFSCFVP
ncbi:unnamed protein product, partial [Laminaria digitata]